MLDKENFIYKLRNSVFSDNEEEFHKLWDN